MNQALGNAVFAFHYIGRNDPLLSEFADVLTIDQFSISDCLPKGAFI